MAMYDYTINWSGDVRKGTIECANNEDSKREVKRLLKDMGVPKGKYVFVDIIRKDDGKVVIEEELWMA